VRLGWIVLAHRGSAQVARLARRLQAREDRTFLHIDKTIRLEPFAQALHSDRERVLLLPRRRSRWGTYGVLGATLDGMHAALQCGCDYLLVISGQDYPIKPIEALRDHLTALEGASFILHWPLPAPDWSVPEGGLWRLNRRHYRFGRFHVHFPNRWTPFVAPREMPLGLWPYAGPNWWCLPREAARYVVSFLEANPEVIRFYRRAALPAESLFQTVLLNSPLRTRVVQDDLRYVVWKQGESHPETLDSSHLKTLALTPAFLARKFDEQRDPGLLDLIDERLLGVSPLPATG